MTGIEDDDYTIKLDANIEVESIVRNRFEEFEDLCFNDTFSNLFAISSDDEQIETSGESSQASAEYKEIDNAAGSDVSENCASAISDVSAESTDSATADSTTSPFHKTSSEEASSSKEEPISFESRFKYINSKELIVFCIDMSSDMESLPYIIKNEESDEKDRKHSYSKKESCFMQQTFKVPSSKSVKQEKHSPLSMIKRAISMFVHNKNFIDKKHEYSLMVLYDTATWISEFTSNPGQLVDALEDLTETVNCSACDLSSIVSLLTEKYPFFLSSEFHSPEMQRLFRIILIYGRSNCMIEFSDPNTKDVFMDYPALFLDIVYIHEPPSEDNKCVEIYEALCNLDNRNKSYIFETTRSITSLHNAMAKLLSHPLQRAPQKDVNYKLRDIVPQEEGHC